MTNFLHTSPSPFFFFLPTLCSAIHIKRIFAAKARQQLLLPRRLHDGYLISHQLHGSTTVRSSLFLCCLWVCQPFCRFRFPFVSLFHFVFVLSVVVVVVVVVVLYLYFLQFFALGF